MVEVKLGLRTVDLPYTIRINDVTEEMFDELVDEDTKAELLDGVMIVHSPASPRHNRIAGFLRHLESAYAEAKDLGDIYGPDDLIHLATCRKFAPDSFFLKKAHVPFPLPAMEFEVLPDRLIEVLSPSNREGDLEDKRPAYRQARIPEIWFVDPENQEVIVDRRRKHGYDTFVRSHGRLSSVILRGFWIDIAWLWADPLPKVRPCLRRILRS
jgi:Uma2 family endonuclease